MTTGKIDPCDECGGEVVHQPDRVHPYFCTSCYKRRDTPRVRPAATGLSVFIEPITGEFFYKLILDGEDGDDDPNDFDDDGEFEGGIDRP